MCFTGVIFSVNLSAYVKTTKESVVKTVKTKNNINSPMGNNKQKPSNVLKLIKSIDKFHADGKS